MASNIGVTYNPNAYLLLVAFGGQLEPKINREYMVNGFNVQRLEIRPGEEPDLSDLDLKNCKGTVFSGGNDSVYADDARQVPDALMSAAIPKLGICYGQQAIVHQAGGEVQTGRQGEYGVRSVKLGESVLFKGVSSKDFQAMMNHRDVVTKLPKGYRAIARSPAGIAGITNDKDIYAVQFHPESSDTTDGTKILLNFAREVCKLAPEPGFTQEEYRQRLVNQQSEVIQHELSQPNTHAIVFDSGGVDSAVAHALAFRALEASGHGDRLTGIYVDTGLMRQEDGDTIKTMNKLGYPVDSQDWSQFFLHEPVPVPASRIKEFGFTHFPPMDSVTDPAIMRKIVKYGFVEVQRRIGQQIVKGLGGHKGHRIALIQGTNLADKIESGDFRGDQIKEHHNSGLEELVDLLIEPISSLFKGDIRELALKFGLPKEIAYRQPFPGPGLCLRLVTNATGQTVWPEDIEAKRQALDKICHQLAGNQMTACWLPMKATGQKGDSKVLDYMTLISGPYDPQLIEKLAAEIPSHTGASRVLYTPTQIGQVGSLKQMINEESLTQLREVEEAKRQAINARPKFEKQLSQHYVASLPINIDGSDKPTVMIRLFRTGIRSGLEDFITGEAALGGLNVDDKPFHEVLKLIDLAARANGFAGAVYDATCKPPGTVELS